MATAAFRSTTRRTSIGGETTTTTTTTPNSNSNSNSGSRNSSSSSSHLRRSRSVSRFSHRLSPPSGSRKGKFVNTVRGSDFPEISLDDLAIEMFSSSDVGSQSHQRGRASMSSEVSSSRRGRSVSRRGNGNDNGNGSGSGPKVDYQVRNSNGVSRRRRSLSVVPNYHVSDSENEHIGKHRSQANPKVLSIWSKEKPQTQRTSSTQQRGLQRCSSQKDLLRSYDGYSSYSSTLTDDGENDTFYDANRTMKGMQAAFGQKKAQNQLSEFGSNNGRNSADSDVLKTVSTIRKNYKTKLEESEKRKQELLAEIMLEEERGKELKKIVVDLLPNPKSSPVKRATRGRKKSTDRNKMPKQLEEDVDKIIEDFISSVEETDMSSFDGERSDTSSVLGGALKPTLLCGETESYKSPLGSGLPPVEMDGVVLPWLKWETGNDGIPLLSTDNKQQPRTPRTALRETQEMTALVEHEQSSDSRSSRGSWSPGVANSFSLDLGQTSIAGEVESCKSQLLSQVPRKSRVDVDNYLRLPSNESFLSERWEQRGRIDSGGLFICNNGKFGDFLL